MKKTTITISFDEEKFSALKMYLAQKNMQAESELEKSARNSVCQNRACRSPRVHRNEIRHSNCSRTKASAQTKAFSFFCCGRR